MKEKIQKLIQDNNLFERNDNMLIALSGGVDSIVLLHFLHAGGYKISAAHCNFKLRAEESDGDEEFVRQFAKDLGIRLFTKSFDTKDYANRNKVSIQIAARELRYEWFDELLKEYNFAKLVVAHHLDDNIETFFINYLRGSGLAGMKGIPVKQGKIIRPMLSVYRDEIVEYAKSHDLSYREDSSNKSKKYLRNKIRHELLDTLKSMSVSSEITIAKSMSNLADDNQIFNQLVDEKRNKLIKNEGDYLALYYSDLHNLKPLKSWLYRLLNFFEFSRDVCDSIAESLVVVQSGKEFYSETHRIISDRNKLIISKISHSNFDNEYEVDESIQNIKMPVNLVFEKVINYRAYKFESDNSIAYFDYEKLKFPLKLRKWRKGDRFKPFGLRGNKLVSDYFVDQKLSVPEKENIWILCSGDRIIWIVGMRSSDSYKVNSSTKTILKVKLIQKV